MSLKIDTATALRAIGEAFKVGTGEVYGLFDHPDQVYVGTILAARPTLVIATGEVTLTEGDLITRVADGAVYEVVMPPEKIDEGSLVRVALKAL